MKQKLQKQKGRLMSSLLPQKWLMSLLTLLLFCIGGGEAWAQTVSWTEDHNNVSYVAGQELSSNTDIISVKLGNGDWTYKSNWQSSISANIDGIYSSNANVTVGSVTITGSYLEITPKLNVTFTVNIGTVNNATAILIDKDNPTVNILANQRARFNWTINGGVLSKNKTYYLYLGSMSTVNDFFRLQSFTATKINHVNPTAALDCAAEITASIGEAVNLSAHYTGTEVGATGTGVIWRHAKNENGTMSLIPGQEDPWAEYANSFTFTPTATGDYYFGVRGRHDCAETGATNSFGTAESAVYVHVHVAKPSTCTNNNHTIYGSTVGTGSDGFNTAFSQFYELESGKQYHFTFHIDGGDTTWKNWYLQAAKTQAHNGDNGWAELLWIRADKHGTGVNDFHLYKGNMNTELNANNANISTFGDASTDADMRKANVDMTVTYAENRLFVFAKTTGTASGTAYYLTGVKEVSNGGNPVQLFFGVEQAKITNLVGEKKSVYSETVHLEKGKGTGRITVDEIDAPYYESNGDKISYFASGVNIKIYATPADGWLFERIGSVYTNPREFPTRTQNDTFNLNFNYTGILYNLNGGEGKTEEPLGTVTLPRPTKAGHTFIGWMNAAGDITPTAGLAGETKTYNAATTLYALWYKNNCEIDFTSTGPLAGTPAKAGASISETGLFIAGGTPVGNITINEHQIDSRFGVQTGTNWMYYNGGLYQYNTGNRAIGLKECVEGEYITIVSSANPNVNAADAEFISQDGNAYTYRVLKDTNVKFTPARNTTIYSITIASPCPHTVWTNGNVADADHLAGWWQNFSQNYKIKRGQTLNFRFTNHGGNVSAQNWCFYAQAIEKHNGDLGVTTPASERVIMRADGLLYSSTGTASDEFTRDGVALSRGNWGVNINDQTFIDDMKNAVIDMTVEYGEDRVMKVVATADVNGHKYVWSKTTNPQAESEETLYLFLVADNSWIEGITHPIKFADTTPHITITSAGTAAYTQPALGAPEGTWVKYEVVEGADKTTVESASISQIDGSSEYTLNIKGKGKVTVRATCGGNTAEYVLTVDGLMFTNPSPYEKHGTTSYDMVLDEAVDGVKFELVKYDTTPCLRGVTLTKDGNNKTCHIANIPNGADDGGIIVVRATKSNSDGTKTIADCCLTIAYDLHVWNMYSDPLVYGSLVEGNDKTRDIFTDDFGGTTGALDNGMNPQSRVGSAHYVIYDSSKSYTYVKPGDEDKENSEDEQKTNNNRVEYNNWMDGQDYYAKENWFNAQSSVKECNADGGQKDYDLLHRHWRFTYKTCTYDNGVRTYVNEPLFAYKNTVIGDNGRIIKQTAGLRFNAPSLKFGVSDNDTKDSEGGSRAIREQDRCVLLQVGSRLCIPRVKEGRYIRIHWYRHSDNNGDRVRITNGEDLDGREIDPRDVIRFTGSHYYEDHKGSFVFKVKKSQIAIDENLVDVEKNYDGDCCDVFIDPTGIGWTEFYRIEIMENFESELQLAEVDVANKITEADVKGKRTSADIGKPYATIDGWNSHDLNNADSYNRTVFDAEKANHPVLASRLTSRIKTHAQGRALVEYAPELYISGYAGHCYTWNGWLQTTLQVRRLEDKGTAWCDGYGDYNNEYKMDNIVPAEPVWVGNNLKYTMHPLKHVKGEGNLVLTLRTHSGWIGEPHYTFDKREAIVAVGEYSVQDYPYTWDFTDYNFGLDNAYGSKTYDAMGDGNVNVQKQYGYWEKDGSDATIKKMGTYQNKISGSFGTGKGTHKLYDENKRTNLPKFAQGSQLSLGTIGDKHTILETEGLRINIPAVNSPNNLSAVKLVQKTTNNGYLNDGYLVVNGTVTIPEVDKDMYIFIKGTRPASASNTKDSDTQFAPNVVKYNANADVTCYQATGGADGTKADVVLTFNGPATLYKIGVTNQKKAISYFGWSTESRAVDIDYNETRYFSADVESFYVHDATNWDHRSDNFNLDTDLEVRLQGTSAGVDDRLYIPQGTGIVMHDKDCIYDSKVSEDSGAGTSYVVPLFVNACNVPQTNTENYQNNILEASTNKDKKTTTITTSLESDDVQYYTMSNYYVGAKLADNTWSTGKFYTTTPRFYRYIGAGGYVSSITLENMSFLKVEKAKNVKILNDIISVDFGYGVDTDPTAIEIIGWDGSEINNGIYYNLRGQAINGKPVVPGIYIKNGKKYYVK